MGKDDTPADTFRAAEGGSRAQDAGGLPPAYDYASAPAASNSAPPPAPPPPDQAQPLAPSARGVPPPGAQRARAPLNVKRENKSIKEDFVVALGENKRPPDAALETSNAPIDAALYLTGSVPRAAVVAAETRNGSVRLRVQRDAGQAVAIRAVTQNSKVHVWLPSGFDGLVTAKTANGKTELSPALRACAVLWPGQSDAGTQTWAVRLGHGAPTDAEPGADRAYAETRNAGVRIYADIDEEGGEGGEKCVIA